MRMLFISRSICYRIKELRIENMFIVPEDMCQLETVEDSELILGRDANELNAYYAAEMYDRIRGINALLFAFILVLLNFAL